VYESNFRGEETLVGAFYQPMLSEAVQYDRLAGYLSLQNLADALQGVESAFETDGEIRIIASKKLGRENNPSSRIRHSRRKANPVSHSSPR